MVERALHRAEVLAPSRRAFIFTSAAALYCAHSSAGVVPKQLVKAARQRTLRPETYDGAYRRIGYPMGDVPDHLGVCTDLVIRAFRSQGVDLQFLVHEDMSRAFKAYPSTWGNKRPDPNIDHRRVPNLQVFFARQKTSLAVSGEAADYQSGNLVTWLLPRNLPHIGFVSDRRVEGS